MGAEFDCVDTQFADGEAVDVVIRPEDLDIIDATGAKLVGEVSSSIFRGVHFELCVMVAGQGVRHPHLRKPQGRRPRRAARRLLRNPLDEGGAR
ncbi:MAG: TOBE domain-containing protein [Bacillus subtilis]|nr:TOBE domain-containing protein [Bacillus subtilis]